MKTLWIFCLFLITGSTPAIADTACDLQSIDWSQTTVVAVVLELFHFHPSELDFVACKPYQLKVISNSRIPHAFTAPDFFKSVKLKNPDTGVLSTPSYEELQLAPGTEIDLLIVPTASGDYPLWCSHKFHPSLGMKGLIHVDGKQ